MYLMKGTSWVRAQSLAGARLGGDKQRHEIATQKDVQLSKIGRCACVVSPGKGKQRVRGRLCSKVGVAWGQMGTYLVRLAT